MLTVNNLTAGYDKTMIIRNICIDINNGEVVSIIGRNGVGKSTFMKTLIGLIKQTDGNITFSEQDITNNKSYDRAKLGIGYVPQGHGIFPRLTVEDNLKMGRTINIKSPHKEFDQIYEYFPKLKTRKHQKGGTLSGGEQAMLSIARALVGKPDLLLLDEPSEGIQPNVIDQISDIIYEINKDTGLTVLFVEQNIKLIQNMSHRSYAMDKGTIVGEVDSANISNYDTLKKYLAV